MAFKMKGMDFGNKKVDLTKKPVGPIAEKKDLHNEAAIRTEGPEKIQELKRKGLVPDSQTFIKKKKRLPGVKPGEKWGGKSGAPNYKNPQDYEVFNWGNKATPVRKKKY